MTNLRDQRQATLGASYSIDRELGGGGMLRVYVARRSTRLRRRRQGHRAGAGGGLSGGYAHAQPNKRMDREGFARRGEQGCKAWYVDAEAELKRAEALPIPGMRRANRKDCPRSASQRAECARTSGSSSSKAAASTSTSSADPPLPRTTEALRRSPRSRARSIGEPSGSARANLWLYGHTSWAECRQNHLRSSCPPGGELVGCESAIEHVDDNVGRAPRSRAGRALRTSARARRWRDGHGLPAEGVAYRLAAALDRVVP
jgi:hypothetical protein